MKKISVLLVVILLLNAFTGCRKQDSPINMTNADSFSIYYGVSSYALFGSDKDTLKALSDSFDDLSFEATNKQMDIFSMLSIRFFTDEKQISEVNVDKNGVFWLNGNTECLKIASGSFNYNDIKDIYEKSKE